MTQRSKALTRIHSQNEELNRLQDQLLDKINPLLRSPPVDGATGAAGATGPAGPGGWTLATPPATADARDDEFEGTAFSGWTDVGTRVSTAIDPYATFSTAASWRYSWNSMRPSWLMMQPTRDNTQCGITKSVTLGTNEFVWTRISNNFAGTSNPNPVYFGIQLVDGAYYVALRLLRSAVSDSQIRVVYDAGAGAVTQDILPDYLAAWGGKVPQVAYLALHKVGTGFHAWVAGLDGSWMHLLALTNANVTGTADVQLVCAESNSGNADYPGNIIFGFDFVRFKATATDIP